MFRHKCIRNIRTFKLQNNVRSTDPWVHDNIEITRATVARSHTTENMKLYAYNRIL